MAHLFRSSSPQNRYYAWFSALHTRIDLLLLAPLTEPEFEAVEEAVSAELLAVEKMGNRFDPNSELSRAVSAANENSLSNSPTPTPLSPALFSLLSRCLRANQETGGLFDITINSPDFHPGLINAVELFPSPDNEGGFFHFHRDGLLLDLSGILKGYALERLRSLLPSFGITDALVNLGNSSILSLGNNPSDIPSGHCLTTSGNESATRRHIRNPLTGEFITGRRTISVTTSDAIEGEILSTVRFIQQSANGC